MPWFVIVLAVIGLLVFAGVWLTFNFLGALVTLVVAALVGALADAIVPGRMPFGWVGAIVAGLVGSWLGSMILGTMGPVIAGIPILPALIGAMVLAVLVELVLPRLSDTGTGGTPHTPV